jgi:hypothetical protein
MQINGIDRQARLDVTKPMTRVCVVSYPAFGDKIIGHCYIYRNGSALVGECDFANGVAIPYDLMAETIVIFKFHETVQRNYCEFTASLTFDIKK